MRGAHGSPYPSTLPQLPALLSSVRRVRLASLASGSAFFSPGARLSLEAKRFSCHLDAGLPSRRLSEPAQDSTGVRQGPCSIRSIPTHRHTSRCALPVRPCHTFSLRKVWALRTYPSARELCYTGVTPVAVRTGLSSAPQEVN